MDAAAMSDLVLVGAHSSPYSRKMRAVLRYRRIAHDWVIRGSQWDDTPPPPVPIIPVLAWRDGESGYSEVMVDSSPQITRLEADHGERSIEPSDPATAFLDFLLEDFADEWVAKAMYHYRWANAEDTEKSGRLLPLDSDLRLTDDKAQVAHDLFIDRQVSRRPLVGSTDENAPVIERSFERTLEALQSHFSEHYFCFGERPGRSDFGLFGQLTPLVWWDPTPTALAVELAPRAVMWVQWLDDLSWWRTPEGDGSGTGDGWFAAEEIPETTRALLAEVGRSYAPFLLANSAALESGDNEVVCEIDGLPYRQAPFAYQAKCLGWIRDHYRSLAAADQARVDSVLEETGCDGLVGS